MYSNSPQHYSPLFRNFRAIDPQDYQRIIREYEVQERAIGRLDPHEHFELTVLYVDALFATGAHRKHLLMVDLVIFTSIDRNIQWLHGVDIYERMLFRKAASAFRVQDYPTTVNITQALVRMYPDQPLYHRLLRTALFRQQATLLQLGRGGAIFCLLLTALVIVLDLLVVKNFYPAQHYALLWLRNDLFLLSLLWLGACTAWAFYRAHRQALSYRCPLEEQPS